MPRDLFLWTLREPWANVWLDLDGFQRGCIPAGGTASGGDFREGFQLGGREEQATVLGGQLAGFGFELARQQAALVAVPEHIAEDGLDIFRLRAALGKRSGR